MRSEEIEGLMEAILSLPPAATRREAEARRQRLQRWRRRLRLIGSRSPLAAARFSVREVPGGWTVLRVDGPSLRAAQDELLRMLGDE